MTAVLGSLSAICMSLLMGAHMMLRPAAYLGSGTPPATDPNTVRTFGKIFVGIGVASTALFLFFFLVEGR